MIAGSDGAEFDAAYLEPPPTHLRYVMRRAARNAGRVGAVALALLLHGGVLLFLISRATDARLQSEVQSSDRGAGGASMTVSLGQVGDTERTVSSARTGTDMAQTEATGATTSVDIEADAAPATDDPTQGEKPSDQADAHPMPKGGPVNGAGLGSRANAGEGYDPWSRASLAPKDFQPHAAPGFWDRVARCYKTGLPAQPLSLTVTISSAGDFVGAAPLKTGSASPVTTDPQAVELVIEALIACGPYPRFNHDLSNQMVLTVPAR